MPLRSAFNLRFGASLRQSWLARCRTVVVYGVAYFVADVALNRFAFHDAWNIVWPLNGVTVGILIMHPRSSWLWILLGIETGSGFGESMSFDDNDLFSEGWQRFASLTEVVLSSLLLPQFKALEDWLRAPRIFFRFLTAMLLGPGISGIIAAVLFHYLKRQAYLSAFNDWATADALGIATTLPLVISLSSAQMRGLFVPNRLPKTVGLLCLACAGAGLIFSVSRVPLVFLLYPLLLLVDSQLEFAGSAIAVVALLLVSMFLTTQSLGPFGLWSDSIGIPRNLALQIYFGFHILALFPASMMSMERRRLAGELRDSNARLIVLATSDGLTGIANRRHFDECLAQEWQRATRARESLTLAMIDLDNFKQFNDIYGHVAGDGCLRSVAEMLRRQMRRVGDLAARFGGEEFAVLLPNTEADGARLVTEQIRLAIQELNIAHLGNTWNRVTVSIGFASIVPDLGDGQSSLIQLADAALYKAKGGGRNRIETITSVEGLKAVNDHIGDATQSRLLRILTRSGR